MKSLNFLSIHFLGIDLLSIFALACLFSILAATACGKRPSDTSRSDRADQPDQANAGSLEQGDAAMVQRGAELFVKNGCQACHGAEGRGDGPAGLVLEPPPRDFRLLNEYKQGHSMGEIVQTLLTGVPGTPMAPYPHISEEERRAIAAYVVSLQ